MNRSQESELKYLYDSVFNQVQECGDIISSILLISKFITENDIAIDFPPDKLRSIALRSVDNETSTFLWHINALIAASADFEHLLLGIEMMFDRFLGNKDIFIKEKEKKNTTQSTTASNCNETRNKSANPKNNNKYIGNEVVSFVQSYYEETDDVNEAPHTPSINIGKKSKRNVRPQNNENLNANSLIITSEMMETDENREYMNQYRGKISSPISFRMRQQKRMVQKERQKKRGRNITSCVTANDDYDEFQPKQSAKAQFDSMESSKMEFEPAIASPFNVSKFARIVDRNVAEEK